MSKNEKLMTFEEFRAGATAPFLGIVEQQRLECEALLSRTGVDPELSRALAS